MRTSARPKSLPPTRRPVEAVIRMFDPEFDARAIGPQARAPHGDGPRNIDQRKGIEAGAARSQPTASKPSPTRQCFLPSSTL